MGSLITNVFGGIVSLFVGVWFVSIFIVTSPMDRLERSCAPVTWLGNMTTSLSMLLDIDEATLVKTKSMFKRGTYGCKFVLWRVVYEDDWKAAKAAQAKREEEAARAAASQPDARPRKE